MSFPLLLFQHVSLLICANYYSIFHSLPYTDFCYSFQLMATRQSTRVKTLKCPAPDLSTLLPAQGPSSKRKKTNAESCRDYRMKLKEDPEKWNEYRESQNEYFKKYRATLSEEKRLKQNEQARLRMQAKRNRDKESARPAPATRRSVEEQRRVWNEQYQKRTAKLTPQKRAAMNKKRREKRHQKKEDAKPTNLEGNSQQPLSCNQEMDKEKSTEVASCSNGCNSTEKASTKRTDAARRKALERARKALPNSPSKFAEVYINLGNKASPRKKKAIDQLQPSVSGSTTSTPKLQFAKIGENVVKSLASLKKNRSSMADCSRQILLSACKNRKDSSVRANSTLLGVHRSTLRKGSDSGVSSLSYRSRKKKSERKLEVEGEIKNFLELNSTPLPDKKMVSKKTGLATQVLSKPLKDVHREFQEVTGNRIGFSNFAKHRPRHVRLASKNPLRQCLCEYCENVSLKIKAINAIAAVFNNNCRIRHAFHAVDIITCGREEGRWKMDCISGSCHSCSPEKLEEHLHPILQRQGQTSWHRWESTATVINSKMASVFVF